MPKIMSPETHLAKLASLIYEHGQISRSQLADLSGNSTFLVSKLTERLLEGGFIYELGTGESSGGRPPTLLSITPGIGRLVGVHMGTVNLRVVVTDMCGNILARRVEPSFAAEGPSKALEHMLNIVQSSIKESEGNRGEVLGIGMGISGVLDREKGITLFWPKIPSWLDVPVKSFLEGKFQALVEVDDTVRTMALAERKLGKGQGCNEFIYVTLGAGTGAALFFEGRLYTGKGGFAGEFGHTTIDERGPLCSCGNRGCVEALVSASAIIRQAKEALAAGLSTRLYSITQKDGARVTLEAIAQAAEANDRFCLSLLSEVGVHVGIGIAGLINLLNPELIVLAGGLPRAVGQWLMPSINRTIQERSIQNPASQVKIELSELPEIDWARGATFLVAEKCIHNLLLAQM